MAKRVVAVVGTVGVPGRYGGFETLAEQLARNIVSDDVEFVIYGQKSAYTAAERLGRFAGHRRVFLPLAANGPQSLIHDCLALLHAALVVRVDAMLVLGVSGAWALPLVRLFRPGVRIVTNIDGLEWRRDKFGVSTKYLLRLLENVAVLSSHAVIADNAALVPIVRQMHRVEPAMIAYGGDHTLVAPEAGERPRGHWLVIARIEPENNCGLILAAAAAAAVPLIFVGNWATSSYGRDLRALWDMAPGLTLLDPVYEQTALARLREGAVGYIHGHSVGGTNPSLVEALFNTNRIAAFDCVFNRATLQDNGGYFADAEALAMILVDPAATEISPPALEALRATYNWRTIAAAYRTLL